jgi:di/tricarboxylate transporter
MREEQTYIKNKKKEERVDLLNYDFFVLLVLFVLVWLGALPAKVGAGGHARQGSQIFLLLQLQKHRSVF